MEYVFGTSGQSETLRTKGRSHTDLTGYHQVEQTFPGQTVTDSFRVVRKLNHKEDPEGNCYDWYEIDRRYRVVDRTPAVTKRLEEVATSVEDALCDMDAATEQRLTGVEDALCELDAKMNP